MAQAEQDVTNTNDVNSTNETIEFDSQSLPTTLVDPNITPDEHQLAAINELIKQKYGAIVGAAGTGKSTTIKMLVERLLTTVENPNICFLSFTGRSVEMIKRVLPIEFHSYCYTIHRKLEYAPTPYEKIDENGNLKTTRIFEPQRDHLNPLQEKIVIIDEGGMVPIDLFNNLMDAVLPETRIYFLGDIQQLPPVQGRSVLGFVLQKWPSFELKRVHRTNVASITDGAHAILQGHMPDEIKGKVIFQRVANEPYKALNESLQSIAKLTKMNAFKPLRDAIITAQNENELGQQTYNERLREFFNPPKFADDEKTIRTNAPIVITSGYEYPMFSVGDKVMATKNDQVNGIANGMIGIITEININAKFQGKAGNSQTAPDTIDLVALEKALATATPNPYADANEPKEEKPSERQCSHIIHVKFQNRDSEMEFSTAGAVNSLQLAYAFTCHKSQGGEYPFVCIMVHSLHHRSLSREWFYTAWTRAQQKIVVFYNPRGMQQALNCQNIKGQTLQEKVNEFQKLNERNQQGEDVKLPNLPEPAPNAKTTFAN